MNAGQALNSFMNPLAMWSRLAWKAGEVAIASAQVIGHRTHRLANTGPAPSARDQREFSLMSQEKGQAALEMAQAMAMPMLVLSQQFATMILKQMLTASAAMISIGASRSAAESAERHSKLVRDTLNDTVAAASKLSGSTAQLARRALKPVHKRVRGNARRLGKR